MPLEQAGWNPSAFELLTADVLAGPPGVAAFDFDNTLIRNDLGEAVMYYILFQALLRADLPEFWEEIRHPALNDADLAELRRMWGGIETQGGEDADEYMHFVDRLAPLYGQVYAHSGMAEAYRWSRVLFAFQGEKELRSIARYVFGYEQNQPIGVTQLPSGLQIPRGIRVYREVHALIRAMLERGWDVRIVTASPQVLIQAVITHWGIAENRVHGMRLERGPHDLLLPRIVEPMPVQAGKVARLQTEVDGPLDFMIGDSIGDFELLRHAKRAILIDRGNAELKAAAVEAGMIIQQPFPVAEEAPPDAAYFI